MAARRDQKDTDPTGLIDGDTEIDLAPLDFAFDTEVEPARRRASRETSRYQPGGCAPPVGAIRLPTDSDRPLPHPQVGSRYLNYSIRRRLARGAMGLIYEAEHLHLQRPVAIKFLAPSLLTDENAVLRFLGEARAMARIDHPGIPTVFDFGQDKAGNAYLIMERLRGEALADFLDTRTVDLKLALELGAQIADALGAAHQAGVIHRDLKPDNVFLVDGDCLQIKLVDFGVSHLRGGDRAGLQTASGCLVGTPAYMAPEQTYSDEVTPATDLYALGCLLFELISGTPVFAGSVAELIDAHRHRRPPELDGQVPRELVDLVSSMLDKHPARRPTCGATVARKLRLVADELGIRWADPLATTDQLQLEHVELAIERSERRFADGTAPPQERQRSAPDPFAMGLEPETTPLPFMPMVEATPQPFPSSFTGERFYEATASGRLMPPPRKHWLWMSLLVAVGASLVIAGLAMI